MMEEQEKAEQLYIPEAKLDPNVKRMAWLVFMEWWKHFITTKGPEITQDNIEVAYSNSLMVAKIVWHEQEKGYEQA